MIVRRKKPIQWVTALENLSPIAYYLLGIIWYKDISITDKSLMRHAGIGVSSLRKYKKELFDNNYLSNKQVDKSKYKYIVGENV